MRDFGFKRYTQKQQGDVIMQHTILIVDDEPTVTAVLRDALSREPYVVLSAGCAQEALPILERKEVDVVISDEKMPGMSGTEFLAVVRKKYPDSIRMILTGHASLESAVRAINEGEIYRFFTKPCNVLDVALSVRKALQQRDLRKESQRLLRLQEHQLAMVKSLERQYPGITQVNRDAKGEILIDDSVDKRKWDTLIREMGQAVRYRRSPVAERA
jgi:two-component system probable response regulator PhcQ